MSVGVLLGSAWLTYKTEIHGLFDDASYKAEEGIAAWHQMRDEYAEQNVLPEGQAKPLGQAAVDDVIKKMETLPAPYCPDNMGEKVRIRSESGEERAVCVQSDSARKVEVASGQFAVEVALMVPSVQGYADSSLPRTFTDLAAAEEFKDKARPFIERAVADMADQPENALIFLRLGDDMASPFDDLSQESIGGMG